MSLPTAFTQTTFTVDPADVRVAACAENSEGKVSRVLSPAGVCFDARAAPEMRTPAPANRSRSWKRQLSLLQLRVLGVMSPRTAARRAIAMFCSPTPSLPKARVAADDQGAHVSMLNVDGHDLAIYTWGDPHTRPYVLLAHGWCGQSSQLLPWVEALCTAGYAVVAFDQQAHGRSGGGKATLPDFVCNLRAVGWRYGRALAVIGHGLGGTAAALALKHGLEADRAILIAAQADPEEAIMRFTDGLGLPAAVCQRMIALLESETGVCLEDLQAHRNVPHLARPALLVHDVEDREVPWSDSERYARHWPDSYLLSTTGLGHHDIVRDAQVISAAMDFIAGAVAGERVVGSPNLHGGFY